MYNDDVINKISSINNNSTIQQMRKIQEQIDKMTKITKVGYSHQEYVARINEAIKAAVSPPELKILSDWFKKNQEMKNTIKAISGTEQMINYFRQNINLSISAIQTTEEDGQEYLLLNTYPEDVDDEGKKEIKDTNNKIVSEILKPNSDIVIPSQDISQIVVLPINNDVLKYFLDNPNELFKLTGTQFEDVMAEIYSRLGYDVTQTKKTRDGGKDIIIRKPEAIGDFIYYVECKKYALHRHIGVGLVRNLIGTVNTDRVNGGILATTSFFTRDARQFILDNQWGCQIQMHDYNKIQMLLKQAMY